MTNVIVLFPKIEEAKSVRNLLVRHGFRVPAVCTTGAQALAQADILGAGILVCGYRYVDMMYSELHDCLPPHFEMLLVASRQVWSECTGNDIVCVSMPIQVQDLAAFTLIKFADRNTRPSGNNPGNLLITNAFPHQT